MSEPSKIKPFQLFSKVFLCSAAAAALVACGGGQQAQPANPGRGLGSDPGTDPLPSGVGLTCSLRVWRDGVCPHFFAARRAS